MGNYNIFWYNTAGSMPTTKGGEMKIATNRELGSLMYGLMRGRMAEAGVEPAHLAVTRLGKFIVVAGHKLHEHARRIAKSQNKSLQQLWQDDDKEWFDRLLDWDPNVQIITFPIIAMTWTALLPGDCSREEAAAMLPTLNSFFGRHGYRKMADEELALLSERIALLVAQQQLPGTLGAAGDALLCLARQPLEGLQPGKGQPAIRRRRAYITAAQSLSLQVEQASQLADRKALASNLGEQLRDELRASRHLNIEHAMEIFWSGFEVFFSGTRYIQR